MDSEKIGSSGHTCRTQSRRYCRAGWKKGPNFLLPSPVESFLTMPQKSGRGRALLRSLPKNRIEINNGFILEPLPPLTLRHYVSDSEDLLRPELNLGLPTRGKHPPVSMYSCPLYSTSQDGSHPLNIVTLYFYPVVTPVKQPLKFHIP